MGTVVGPCRHPARRRRARAPANGCLSFAFRGGSPLCAPVVVVVDAVAQHHRREGVDAQHVAGGAAAAAILRGRAVAPPRLEQYLIEEALGARAVDDSGTARATAAGAALDAGAALGRCGGQRAQAVPELVDVEHLVAVGIGLVEAAREHLGLLLAVRPPRVEHQHEQLVGAHPHIALQARPCARAARGHRLQRGLARGRVQLHRRRALRRLLGHVRPQVGGQSRAVEELLHAAPRAERGGASGHRPREYARRIRLVAREVQLRRARRQRHVVRHLLLGLAVQDDQRVEDQLTRGLLEGEGEQPGALGEELDAHVGRGVQPGGVEQRREALARLGAQPRLPQVVGAQKVRQRHARLALPPAAAVVAHLEREELRHLGQQVGQREALLGRHLLPAEERTVRRAEDALLALATRAALAVSTLAVSTPTRPRWRQALRGLGRRGRPAVLFDGGAQPARVVVHGGLRRLAPLRRAQLPVGALRRLGRRRRRAHRLGLGDDRLDAQVGLRLGVARRELLVQLEQLHALLGREVVRVGASGIEQLEGAPPHIRRCAAQHQRERRRLLLFARALPRPLDRLCASVDRDRSHELLQQRDLIVGRHETKAAYQRGAARRVVAELVEVVHDLGLLGEGEPLGLRELELHLLQEIEPHLRLELREHLLQSPLLELRAVRLGQASQPLEHRRARPPLQPASQGAARQRLLEHAAYRALPPRAQRRNGTQHATRRLPAAAATGAAAAASEATATAEARRLGRVGAAAQ
eukprot:scaffold57468_cov62-Phaeocystis_antarctica.AAC.6